MTNFPAVLLCDFYKLSHKPLYPANTKRIYSTLTPRSNTYFKETDVVVPFSFQVVLYEYLIKVFNETFFNLPKDEVIAQFERYQKLALMEENPDSSHIAALHELGYLPIKIKAIKEGMKVPFKTPILTIENTIDEFFWVTNSLETLISSETWQPIVNATMAYQLRKYLDEQAMLTVGHTNDVPFQGHDFSFRGMTNKDAAAASGAAHLLSFVGTDTIPAIDYLEKYYGAKMENELIGTSIVATEHSVMSANTNSESRDELAYFKELITEKKKSGFISIVSDTYNFWDNVERVIPALKNEIMNRDGRVVIRPDSGNPVEIVCGEEIIDFSGDLETKEELLDHLEFFIESKISDETPHGEYGGSEVELKVKLNEDYYKVKADILWNRYDKQFYFIDTVSIVSLDKFIPSAKELGLIEHLWNTFGGTITEQGYKQLDTHIGAIYGDGITLERAQIITERLKLKGFASTNLVMGIGSYTYTYNTRDTVGLAMKATYGLVGDEERFLFKDPITDPGKRSQRGRVFVYEEDGAIKFVDGLTIQAERDLERKRDNLLETIFEDGVITRKQTLREIRDLIKS